MNYILAIDQGTTGSRAIIYDKNGTTVASSYKEFPQYFPRPGWVEHNPEELWKSVYDTLHDVIRQVPYGSIAAIGITNQRETTVIWDKTTGVPVYNAIVWQCRRTAERCMQLKKKSSFATFVKHRSGLPLDAYFSATKIEWILKNVRGALSKARKGKLLFGTTDSWILWNLTGGKVHATDYTNASRTMVFNIERLKWDHKLLRAFGIPRVLMPQVLPSSGMFGRTVKRGDIPARIPITGIAGDQQAALFGQTCFDKGTMKNTYGTGSFLLLNTGKKKITSRHGLITTLGCGANGMPVYVLEGSVFVAGAAIQWLRDQMGILAKSRDAEGMALSVPDTGGVYFVPAFVGLGAPYWDQTARGTITGLTRGTTKAHLVRAATEAMCYQTKEVIAAMEADSGLTIRELNVDGGASRDNFLCQFQADILGMPVTRPTITETTSLGVAYLAGLAVGIWNDAAEIRRCWKKERTFTPALKKNAADELYRGWQAAVQRTLGRAVKISNATRRRT